MAYIVKTPSGTYAVMRRIDGKLVKKTFKTKAEATKFRALIELNKEKTKTTVLVKELMEFYLNEQTRKKRGSREETIRIKSMMGRPFALKALTAISRKDIQKFVNARLEEKSSRTGINIGLATIIRECATLSAIFKWAVKSGMMDASPVTGVDLPKPPEHRETSGGTTE